MEAMPAPASIVVIVNIRAGTATKGIDTELADLFHAAGRDAEIISLAAGESPTNAARSASARASIVVAGGGDGTVNGVATGLFGSPAALGVLPLGTLNHFAKNLRLPHDLREAVAVVAAGHIGHVDVGQVNDRVFVNNSSIGIYPGIVEAREELRRQGHSKWPAMAIATLRVLRRYRGVTVSIMVDGRRRTWRTPFVFVGNNEYAIDGIRLGARARLDEGKLFVYLTPRLRARHLPVLLVKALLGRAGRSGDFEIVPATELWIDVSKARHLRVAVDGELIRMRTPLHYRTRPKALPVVLPQP
jgi:diacylglycerol kinase family enzyme